MCNAHPSCAPNAKAVSHSCVVCGKTGIGAPEHLEAGTPCTATSCATNEKVMSHKCVACPAGSTNSAGHDASGADTVYSATSWATNEEMVNHSGVVCPGRKRSRGERRRREKRGESFTPMEEEKMEIEIYNRT